MGDFGVAIVGGGTWGLALAAAAARVRGASLLWSRRAQDEGLPPGVEPTHDLRQVGERARLIFLAVPSQVARDVARSLGDVIDGRHLVVHGVRGLRVADTSILPTAPLRGPAATAVLIGEVIAYAMQGA